VLTEAGMAADWSVASAGSVALVGARPGRVATEWLPRNLRSYGFSGDIWLVSRRTTGLTGNPVFTSVEQLPAVPSIVVLAVSPAECIRLTRYCTSRGTKVVVVYANGFAETGTEEGRALERELVSAVAGDAVLLGPSSLGMVDFTAGVCAFGPPIPGDLPTGCVSLISQSGALLCSMLGAAAEEGFGLDWCVSVGSGAGFGVAQAAAYALRRASTQVLGIYFESFGSRAELTALARPLSAAAAAGKRVVVVKAGASAAGASVAQSHTGSISGDDRLADAFFRSHGVIRAESIEDLVRTVNVLRLARRRPPRPGQGLAIIEPSGGSTAVAADLAARYGVPLATFSDATQSFLADLGGASAHVSNPVDLTAAAHDEAVVDRAYQLVQEDPGVGAVLVPWSVSLPDSTPARHYHRASLARHIRLAASTGVPVVIATAAAQRWTDWAVAQRSQLPPNAAIVQGAGAAMRALRAVLGPAQGEPVRPGAASSQPDRPRPPDGTPPDGTLEEARALSLLAEAGLRVPRRAVLRRAELAASGPLADAGIRPPFAVKLIASGLAHKAGVGGVELGVAGLSAVAAAAQAVIRRAEAAGVPSGDISGVLVAEMAFGPEIMAGLSRDGVFGDFLVVGWGGILTEALRRHEIELLDPDAPCADAVDRALARLGGAGLAGAALQAVAPFITHLCEEFTRGRLRHCGTVEVNPLIADPRGTVAVDALVIVDAEGT
jgi:acyl-CoA synthetase (NDP forming)